MRTNSGSAPTNPLNSSTSANAPPTNVTSTYLEQVSRTRQSLPQPQPHCRCSMLPTLYHHTYCLLTDLSYLADATFGHWDGNSFARARRGTEPDHQSGRGEREALAGGEKGRNVVNVLGMLNVLNALSAVCRLHHGVWHKDIRIAN